MDRVAPRRWRVRCGFEQVLKDQRCLGLVESQMLARSTAKVAAACSVIGERLLRVSAMNGRVFGQFVEDRLLRRELPPGGAVRFPVAASGP